MKRTLVLVVAFGLATLVAVLPASAAGNTATIEGTVVNGSTKAPATGVDVMLSKANTQTGQGDENIQKTKTDEKGRFSFAGVEGGDPWMYDVTAKFKGASYFSKALTPGPGDTAKATLTVFNTTESSKDISLTDWTVYLDTDANGLAVEQAVTYENSGKESFIGALMPGTSQRITVELPVATGATQDSVQTVGLFDQCCGGVVGDKFGHTAPLVPGKSGGTIRYVTTTPVSLSFPASFPTTRLSVLAAPGITVNSPDLQAAGMQTVPGGGPSPSPIAYSVYTVQNLQPGSAITADVTMSGAGTSSAPTAAVLILAVAALTALLLIAVKLRPEADGPSGGSRNATRQKRPPRKAPAPKQPSRSEHHTAIADEDLEADLLVAEIAALDLSFEQGLMQESDYEQLRAARKAQLKKAREGSEDR